MTPQQAIAYFVRMGWTPAQAAGIVANLVAESNLNPAAVGDGGTAVGLGQWHPDRQADFAAIIGKDIRGSSIEDQLAFVHAELNGSEKAAGDALRACVTASEAGACVSVRYERPADKVGEASRRGALAAKLLSQYGGTIGEQPAAPIEERPVAVAPPQGGTMGAGLLLSLLPTVLQMFAPRAQAAAAKITGQPPEVAGQFVQSLFDQLQALTGKPDAIQATAALQANPDPKVVAQLEDHTLDYLDKIAPMVDKLAAAEVAAAARTIAAQDAAALRPDATNLRPLLARSIWVAMAVIVLLLGIAMGLQIAMRADQKPDAEIVLAFSTIVTYMLARLGDVYGYAFGGTQQSRAADIAEAAAQKALK